LKRILHITNTISEKKLDGGGSREEALIRFLDSKSAVRSVVMNERFLGSRWERLTRVQSLLNEVRLAKPEMIVLNYPAYPFYWQHKVTVYYWMAVFFARKLRNLANDLGARIVIDVMDLPRFQYKDLGYELEMNPKRLEYFDRLIFSLADKLWVCSHSLADLIERKYAIEHSKIIDVLNGYNEQASSACLDASNSLHKLRFVYCGSLNKERGIDDLLAHFNASGVDAELHVCGPHGEWIVGNEKLFCHGTLNEADAMRLASSCDVGLIPYPEYGYYHLAFATKLAFYLGAGIPVMCSMAKETASYVQSMKIGLCRPFDQFANAFSEIASSKKNIMHWKANVQNVRNSFSWNAIYEKALGSSA
jgi:glycosyltransferase involved in cell wall biosynthesis